MPDSGIPNLNEILVKNYPKCEIISQNDRTVLLRDREYFIKIFKCEGKNRSEKEVSFYDKYSGKYTPELVSSYCMNGFYFLKFKFLKGFYPGFISDKEIGYISAENFQRIRETISDIQKRCSNGVLVHNDMAPHNIYLSKGTVIIGDWDCFRIYKDISYKMYDYATLWSWLYVNEKHLIDVYLTHERPRMIADGTLSSFRKCYLLRQDWMKKSASQFLNRGSDLRATILDSLKSLD